MKNSASTKAAKPMSLKKLDNEANKAYWQSVERAQKEWGDRKPTWARDADRQRETKTDQRSAESVTHAVAR